MTDSDIKWATQEASPFKVDGQFVTINVHRIKKCALSAQAYHLEYLAHQRVRREHLARWRRDCLVSGNESAGLADQSQATVLHTSKKIGERDDFLQATETTANTRRAL